MHLVILPSGPSGFCLLVAVLPLDKDLPLGLYPFISPLCLPWCCWPQTKSDSFVLSSDSPHPSPTNTGSLFTSQVAGLGIGLTDCTFISP